MNSKPLWEKNSSPPVQRRPPKSAPTVVIQQQASTHSTRKTLNWNNDVEENVTVEENTHLKQNEAKAPYDDILARTNLKVDAPEFIPNNITSNVESLSNSVQCRLKIHKGTSDTSQVPANRNVDGISNSDEDDDYDELNRDMKRVNQLIDTLTKDPGQFDNLFYIFMETLIPYLDDLLSVAAVTDTLVEEAINNSNFRYTGAKLCWHIEQTCPEFRAELHLKCKRALSENPSLHNVVLFIAELYTQLPHLNVYGALLVESFKKLFSEDTNEGIKCICQALKLTGHSLEQSNKSDLDMVMSKLGATKANVGEPTLSLLNSVLKLRQSNWGYTKETESEGEADTDGFFYEDPQNKIVYQTDEHSLTTEESEFLTANLQSNEEYLSDCFNPDDLCDPEPEMDEEIQAAFKEFVKYSSLQ